MAVLGFGEATHWLASHRRLGNRASTGGAQAIGGSEAIVVLGYKNPGVRANYINRYRVRAALRSIDPVAQQSAVVFCGGPVAGPVAEAELMDTYARERLGYSGPSALDRTSVTTWENIQHAIPLIESADVIKIVSNSMHAEKGRAYLWKLRPDLAERLVRGADYRFGEITFVKPLAAVLGLKNVRALRLANRLHGR